MPYQNADATLADIVSPVDAAMQAGQQSGYANLQSAAENAVKQATVPAEQQAPYLKNLFTAAQTAGQRGLAQQEQAKGAVDQALVPTEIGAGQAKGQGQITSAHVDQLQNLGQVVGGVADQMESIPQMVRPAMMSQMLDQFGVTDPTIRQLVGDGNPDNLRKLSQAMFSASDKARQTSLGENIRGGYQLGTAQLSASGKAEQQILRNQGIVQVQQMKNMATQMKQTVDQRIAMLSGQPQTPDTVNELNSLKSYSIRLRDAVAQSNAQLLGLGAPSAPYEGGGNQPAPQGATAPTQQPAQSGGQPPAVEDAVTAEMRKRGLLQ